MKGFLVPLLHSSLLVESKLIMNAKNEKSAVYRRASTDHQDISLKDQADSNDEYSLRFNFDSVGEFKDEDVSGIVPFLERNGGRALLNRLKMGDGKHLVVSTQDRLGCDTLDVITTIRTVWTLGITPHFTQEGGHFRVRPKTSC